MCINHKGYRIRPDVHWLLVFLHYVDLCECVFALLFFTRWNHCCVLGLVYIFSHFMFLFLHFVQYLVSNESRFNPICVFAFAITSKFSLCVCVCVLFDFLAVFSIASVVCWSKPVGFISFSLPFYVKSPVADAISEYDCWEIDIFTPMATSTWIWAWICKREMTTTIYNIYIYTFMQHIGFQM